MKKIQILTLITLLSAQTYSMQPSDQILELLFGCCMPISSPRQRPVEVVRESELRPPRSPFIRVLSHDPFSSSDSLENFLGKEQVKPNMFETLIGLMRTKKSDSTIAGTEIELEELPVDESIGTGSVTESMLVRAYNDTKLEDSTQ